MAKGLRFKDAEKARDEITAEQLKRISKLYNDWADEIAKKAEKLKQKDTMSSELQEQQMKELEQALRKTSQKVANEVNKTVKEGMTKVCQSVISQNEDWMESLGFPKDIISAAFSSVPDNVVRNIVTGKIYDSGWSLSKSIWGDNEDTLTKIHQIVAGGMAENKPIYEIAKSLEQYVRPGAKKQWNLKTKSGKMIYPKRVDYNAQRLARTLSQHAYQQTIKTTSKENPFIQKIKWHSVGNRACEICKRRDGKVYPIDELPMDHPHGFCIMEQMVDDNIDDRLIDWVHGKADKDLDNFAKKLGFDIGDMDVPGAEDSNENGGHKIVQGKQNAINEWHRREGEFDFEIEDVINYQGFDGLPRLVDADEFDELVKKSNFIAQRTYSANSQEILDAYRDQLYNGKWYVDCSTGGAQYGQGMYCAADWNGELTEGIKAEMKHYQMLNKDRGNSLNYTETLTLDESARVVKYEDIIRMKENEYFAYMDEKFAEFAKGKDEGCEAFFRVQTGRSQDGDFNKAFVWMSAHKDEYEAAEKLRQEVVVEAEEIRNTYLKMDAGSYAALKGYDAINAVGHGESGSYTVILNRTKLVVKKG